MPTPELPPGPCWHCGKHKKNIYGLCGECGRFGKPMKMPANIAYTHTIHEVAIPIIIEGNRQVGWKVELPNFTMDAIEDADGTINAYVVWNDDQSGDMSNHQNWHEVASYLRGLIRSTN